MIRLRVAEGERIEIVEKLVAAPPEEFAKIRDVEFPEADEPNDRQEGA